jgi:hypothetical protein
MQDDMAEYMIYEKFLQTCQQVRRLLLGKNKHTQDDTRLLEKTLEKYIL